ncbi:hypothetical protein [Vibrio viridaestus]|uniref:Cation transporter n=1 Tax=Vibrio viridaestus TaxID=2487322 RepID=A0A3N9TAI8_9VIBR|nr:hypothetical protein [Vibrio viridaestus]RQW61049.1 hypothetical protein EES38_21440 [Vibrio viridaestus]
MVRDELGICLSKEMLCNNLESTFTHVRAYQLNEQSDDSQVLFSYPQMKGEDVLLYQKENKKLAWRAEHLCPSTK